MPHLNGLSLPKIHVDDSPFTVDILIGADHYGDIVGNEVIKGPGPTAAKSEIGYLISGPLSNSNHSVTVTSFAQYTFAGFQIQADRLKAQKYLF